MGLLNASGKKRRRDDIYLPDLVKDNAVLEGFQFIDCTVRGPAVLVVQGEFDLVENRIEGDPDAFLWPIDPKRARVIGAILVKDTTFQGCTVKNVGLAGYPDYIDKIRRGIKTESAVSQ